MFREKMCFQEGNFSIGGDESLWIRHGEKKDFFWDLLDGLPYFGFKVGEFIEAGRLKKQGSTKNTLYWVPGSKERDSEEKDSEGGFSIESLQTSESSIKPSDTNGSHSEPHLPNHSESSGVPELRTTGFGNDSEPPLPNRKPCSDRDRGMIRKLSIPLRESGSESSGENPLSNPKVPTLPEILRGAPADIQEDFWKAIKEKSPEEATEAALFGWLVDLGTVPKLAWDAARLTEELRKMGALEQPA